MVIQYIESALFEHKIVVIPDLGGFVKTEVEPTLGDGGLIPTTTTVDFEVALANDASVLLNLIAEGENLTIAEAEQELAYFVAEVKHRLQEDGFFVLGNLGQFQHSDNGLIFSPNPDANFANETYGLPALQLETIHPAGGHVSDAQESKATSSNLTLKEEEDIEEPRKSNLTVWILVIAIALTLTAILYLVNKRPSVPATTETEEEGGPVFGRRAKPAPSDEQVYSPPTTEPEKPGTSKDADKAQEASAPSTSQAKDAPSQTSPTPTKSDVTPTYHVIVGSFGNPDNATKLKLKLEGQGFKVVILDPSKGKKLYKVSIGQFQTEAEAAQFITNKQRAFTESLFLMKPGN